MKFPFGTTVRVTGGTLTGKVEGFAVYDTGQKDVYVRHLDKDGFSLTTSWLREESLEAAA